MRDPVVRSARCTDRLVRLAQRDEDPPVRLRVARGRRAHVDERPARGAAPALPLRARARDPGAARRRGHRHPARAPRAARASAPRRADPLRLTGGARSARPERAERPAADGDRPGERRAVRVAVLRGARRPGARLLARELLGRRRHHRHGCGGRARPDRQGRRPLERRERRHGHRVDHARRQRRGRPRHRDRVADRRERGRRLRDGRLRRRLARGRRPRGRPHVQRPGGRGRAGQARLTRRPDREHELRREHPGRAARHRRDPQGSRRRDAARRVRRQRSQLRRVPVGRPPARGGRTQLRPGRGRIRFRREADVVLELGPAPVAARAGVVLGTVLGRAGRAPRGERVRPLVLHDLRRQRRCALRLPGRHIVLGAGGGGRRGAHLGGAPDAAQLPGGGHHQAVGTSRERVDDDLGLRRPRRGRSTRAGGEPDRRGLGGCAPGGQRLVLGRRRARRPRGRR